MCERECARVCVSVSAHVCMHVHGSALCECEHTCVRVQGSTHVHESAHVYVWVLVCALHGSACTRVRASSYALVCVHVIVCTCARV